jgi:hypothetical protein
MIITSLSSIAARISITTITTMTSVAAVMPITGPWVISLIWTFLSSRKCNSHLFIKPPYWLFCLPQNLDDPRVVISTGTLVPGYYRPWVERLDLVECRDPLLAFLRSWRCSQKHVSAIEGCISCYS